MGAALKTKVRSIGNSNGIILSTEILNFLNATTGDELELVCEDGMLHIIPVTQSLDELIASVPEGKSLTELATGSAKGDEY